MLASLLRLIILTALLLGLPLLGVILNGGTPGPYLQFPPLTQELTPPDISWPIFYTIAVIGLLLLLGTAWLVRRDRRYAVIRQPLLGRWPWWGWLGLLLLIASWVLAWTRFPWFSDWQWATFTPLWLGYIIVINADTRRRTGGCLLLRRPLYLLALFPLSALFWWYFEYLNRFVQNWYYVGIDGFSPAHYILHVSLAFSTVLPAVMSTREWLAGLLQSKPNPLTIHLPVTAMHLLGLFLIVIAGIGLLGLGIWPHYLYPLLWVSPLLLLLGMQGLVDDPPLLQQLREQGGQALYLPALATLQCGFFWEMWNMYSQAKWNYQLPFVHTMQIFEMPVLGYIGYLPFGIECTVIAMLVKMDSGRPA